MNVVVTSPPAAEPVTIDELKTWLHISGSDHDELLVSQREAARRWVERKLRRALITQTVTMELDGREGESPIWLPRPPFQSVTSFERYEDDGTLTTIHSGAYYVSGSDPAKLVLSEDSYTVGASEADWIPERRRQAYKLVYVAGYGDSADDVPHDLREVIKRRVADSFDFRGDKVFGTTSNDAPVTIAELLQPYRYDYL